MSTLNIYVFVYVT